MAEHDEREQYGDLLGLARSELVAVARAAHERGSDYWTSTAADASLGRLLLAGVGAIVGLGEEARREHQETLKVWREVRDADSRTGRERRPAPRGAGGVDRAPEVREGEVSGDGLGRATPGQVEPRFVRPEAAGELWICDPRGGCGYLFYRYPAGDWAVAWDYQHDGTPVGKGFHWIPLPRWAEVVDAYPDCVGRLMQFRPELTK